VAAAQVVSAGSLRILPGRAVGPVPRRQPPRSRASPAQAPGL